jgi:hypothetical protein
MKMKKTAAITICFALTLALLAGAAPRTGAATAARTKKAGIKSSVTIQRRSSYAAICAAVKKAKTNSRNTIYSSAASLNLAEKTADGTSTSAAPTDSSGRRFLRLFKDQHPGLRSGRGRHREDRRQVHLRPARRAGSLSSRRTERPPPRCPARRSPGKTTVSTPPSSISAAAGS